MPIPNTSIAYRIRTLVDGIKGCDVEENRQRMALRLALGLSLLHEVEKGNSFNYGTLHDIINEHLETTVWLTEYGLSEEIEPLFVSAAQTGKPVPMELEEIGGILQFLQAQRQPWSRHIVVMCEVISILVSDRPTEMGFWHAICLILFSESMAVMRYLNPELCQFDENYSRCDGCFNPELDSPEAEEIDEHQMMLNMITSVSDRVDAIASRLSEILERLPAQP